MFLASRASIDSIPIFGSPDAIARNVTVATSPVPASPCPDTPSFATSTVPGSGVSAIPPWLTTQSPGVIDTGRTSAAILDRLRSGDPASLALCALLRKPAAAALDLPVGYAGFDIPDDFVVGYGMDYAERHRNLRGIHRLILDGSEG